MPASRPAVAAPVHDAVTQAAHHPDAAALSAALHRRLLDDPVIRQRIQSDSTLRRMLLQSSESMPEAERAALRRLLMPPASRSR